MKTGKTMMTAAVCMAAGLLSAQMICAESRIKAGSYVGTGNGRNGEVYNVGGHNEKANIEIVRIILAELGKPESLITFVEDRKGHDRRYAIDPSKIRNELGWEPETMFAEGIRRTIRWYLDHPEWMEEVTSGDYVTYYEKMYGSGKTGGAD